MSVHNYPCLRRCPITKYFPNWSAHVRGRIFMTLLRNTSAHSSASGIFQSASHLIPRTRRRRVVGAKYDRVVSVGKVRSSSGWLPGRDLQRDYVSQQFQINRKTDFKLNLLTHDKHRKLICINKTISWWPFERDKLQKRNFLFIFIPSQGTTLV